MRESKEKIKSRMIKNVSRLWGFQDTEAESSFDPFMGMIIGALASELEKVSSEIHYSESRVVEKLIELLTPESMTGAFPAHTVLYAMPVQPFFRIYPEYQFYCYKKIKNPSNPAKTEEKSVFFTPAGSYNLHKGNIRFLATGKNIFEIQEEQYKEVYSQSRLDKGLAPSTMWFGLEFDDGVQSIDGLSLYFDLRSKFHEDAFYQSLSRGKWYINGHPVQFSQGYGENSEMIKQYIDAILKQELDVTAKVCNHINRFYSKNFITLSNGNYSLEQLSWQENIPPAFKDIFDHKELEKLPQKLCWIKVELSQPMLEETLEDVFCSINCFPAINRQLNDFTRTSKEYINIIPLYTEDAFLDMKKVTNNNGEPYTLKTFTSVDDITKGAYIIRHSGIGRFDSRNAVEILNYLLELLRDESAAFSILGTDMITTNLRELNQTISRLEQRLEDCHVTKESTSYMMLKALPEDETVFIEFWSTTGSFANKIKAGNKLSIYEGSDLVQDSVRFMTPTFGGREKMDTGEKVNTYRKALLSRDRIITAEDIKALCFEHFDNALEKVEISKGVMKGLLVNSGFVRTIDIYLIFSKQTAKFDDEELKFLKEDLKVKLEERSTNILPYRIFIKENSL